MATWDPRANDLFLKALEVRSVGERREYLDGACAGDTALRDEVESLLEASARAGSFLESPAPGMPSPLEGEELEVRGGATVDEPIRERPGTVIGPYKLLQEIGEGGMGTVFMAEQSHPVRRKVALKVIKAGMDSRQVVARFEAERQALAMMDHVNIARVLDAGTTESGRPYFVMELVHGVQVTRYCDDNRLTPHERLELFVPVCQAIQHAHQKGIIHRDIKPSNVMVTLYDGKPVPKVIDFGVAKATEQKLTERTLFTQYGAMVGTLEYMSPEQAETSALGVDTRSDIFSLGVLLYELLTGSTPLSHKRVREAAYAEVVRMIREEEPPKPSTRLSDSGQALASISAQRHMEPAKLSKLMRGELDWIVMKSLEKDRNRRYETASSLGRDVRRYLDDEAVEACPPSTFYRLRKFTRRHKAVLLIGACMLIALLVAGGSIGWMVRDQVTRETALDRVVDLTLDEVEGLIEEAKWPDAEATIQRAEKLLGAAGRRTHPQRLLEMQRDFALARRLEDIYSRPKKEEFYTGHELDAAYAAVFTELGLHFATMSVAEAAERIQARGIRRELIRALDIWAGMRKAAGNPETPDWKRLLEIAEASDPDPWRNSLRQAQRQGDGKALAALAASADVARLRPETLHLLGSALHDGGAKVQALALLRQAQVQYPESWWINNMLGWYLVNERPPQYEDALRYYTAAQAVRPNNPYNLIAMSEALMGKKAYGEAVVVSCRSIEIRPDAAETWFQRGHAFLNWGQHDKAAADFSKAIELRPTMAAAWSNRGVANNHLKQWDKAIVDYSKAIELNPTSAVARTGRGMAYGGLGQIDKALGDYSRAIELDSEYVTAWNNRGAAYNELHQLDKAVADLTQAIKLDAKYATAWNNRGTAYNQLNQLDEALADLSQAIKLDSTFVQAWYNRGLVHEKRGQSDKALADYSQAIELDPKWVKAWVNIGVLHAELGQWDTALSDYSQAIELDPKRVTAWLNRGAIYCDKLNQLDKAFADFSQAIQLDPKKAAAWHNRGLVHGKRRDWDKALADYSQAIVLDPTYVSAWTNRGQIYGKLGQWAKAAADYARIVALEPDNADAGNKLAYCHVVLGRYPEALDLLGQLVERFPKDVDPHNDLAVLLATCPDPRFRNPSWAVEVAKRAAALAPTNGRIWNTLGMAHFRAGAWQDGVAALQKSTELDHDDVNGWFFRAMGHWQLNQKDEARKWYDQSVVWMDQNQEALPKHGYETQALNRLRAEAAELLEIKQK